MAKTSNGNLRYTDKERLAWDYRQYFLAYTEKEAREFMKSLKELVPAWESVMVSCPLIAATDPQKMRLEYLPANNVCTEFKKSFNELLEKYGLTADWLRSGLFKVLIKSAYRQRFLADTEKLAPEVMDSLKDDLGPAWESVMVSCPLIDPQKIRLEYLPANDVCTEFKKRFNELLKTYGLTADWLFKVLIKFANTCRLSSAYTHAWPIVEGEEINLQMEGWQISESWEEFEARARCQFEEALKNHKEVTIKHFEDSGYKKTTKPLNFSSVKWLVLWTVKGMRKEEILREIKNEQPSSMTVEDLNTEFRRLERGYQLPVRRTKRKTGKIYALKST